MADNSNVHNDFEQHSTEDNISVSSPFSVTILGSNSSFNPFPRQHWAYASSQTIVSSQSLQQEELNPDETTLETAVHGGNEDNIFVAGLSEPVLVTTELSVILSLPSVSNADVGQAPFFAEESLNIETSRSGFTNETAENFNRWNYPEQQPDFEGTSQAIQLNSSPTEVSHSIRINVGNGLHGHFFALQEPSEDSNSLVSVSQGEPVEVEARSIQENEKTNEPSHVNICKDHNNQLLYFCDSCKLSICETCWEFNHRDTNKHHVILFKFKLAQQTEFYDRVINYKNHFTHIADKVNFFLESLCELEAKQKEVMKSTNNEEFVNSEKVVKELMNSQISILSSLQTEMGDQLALMTLSQSGSDELSEENTNEEVTSDDVSGRTESLTSKRAEIERRQLLSLNNKFVFTEDVYCREAVYNSEMQEILCYSGQGKELILKMDIEKNSLFEDRTVVWRELRENESDDLLGIAVAKNNTLYGCIFNARDMKWRVSVLKWSDLREEREVDTRVIEEQDSDTLRYWWHLSGCGNKLAIFTATNKSSDKVCRWEFVYIYSEERCMQRVRIDFEIKVLAFHVCFIGSHFIVKTSGNSLAVVPLGDINFTEQNTTTRVKNKNKKKNTHSEAGQLEESRARGIKHITLLETKVIWNFVWVERDDRELDEETKRISADGYLFVADYYTLSRRKCSVYELDLDRVKNGDRVNSRKDLEIKDMFPICVIDNSNLFAIQGGRSVKGKPSIIALEYNSQAKDLPI